MARKRFISSDISTDEALASIAAVNPKAALMWPWFLTAFDDWGRMEGSATKIRLSIFPAFPFTDEDVDEAIRLFGQAGLVHVYYAGGRRYLAVDPEKFYYYQTYISEKRKADCKSSCPAPTDAPWNQDSQGSKNVLDDLQKPKKIGLSLSHSHSLSTSTTPQPPSMEEGDAAPADELPPDPMEPVTKFLIEHFIPTATAYHVERLAAWVEQDNMEPDLIVWAMEQALLNGERKLNYVEGILRRCRNAGITTRRAAELAEEERRRSRDRPRHIDRSEQIEPDPDQQEEIESTMTPEQRRMINSA